jgi:hypothetical protein
MLGPLLRKLRGILGTGISWAIGWSILGTAVHWSLAVLGLVGNPNMMVEPFMYGLMGFYGGCVFGGVLSLMEGRRSLADLHLGKIAVWGALAGLLVPVVYHLLGGGEGLEWFRYILTSPDSWLSPAIIPLLGAASAAGMTAVARSGSDPALGEEESSTPLPSGSDPRGSLDP